MPLFHPTRALHTISETQRATYAGIKNWSTTLALPKTSFPARATRAELDKYRRRCADDLYAWQRQNRPAKRIEHGREVENEFVLHDGPPYANGPVHVGHALNKVLKDLILRSELARGRRVHYRPGWDCHGLPIELKALQQARTTGDAGRRLVDVPKDEATAALVTDMTASEIRRKARRLASETIDLQKESFREWGVMGEWDTPYKTMDLEFEIRQLEVFREMARKGLISRHKRPVYWSPSSRTALAEAELEYDDNHKCTAAFVKMPFVQLPRVLANSAAVKPDRLSALIWTTTPWTLPANQVIAVKADAAYCVLMVETRSDNGDIIEDQVVLATACLDRVLQHLPEGARHRTILEGVKGEDLVDTADRRARCLNLFQGLESPILAADFVTTESGTGLVHMAPGHGMEDYQVYQTHNDGPLLAPVDADGRFTADVATSSTVRQRLEGLDVQTDGVAAILHLLSQPTDLSSSHSDGRSLLLASHSFTHKNPTDWRTKQPVIVRATAQWFADLSAIKNGALKALERVKFLPDRGKSRLSAFIEGRSQWCISRQRAWGVPIPALFHKVSGNACITDESIEHIISIMKERGTDAWFSDLEDEPAWICSSLEPEQWVRGKDTMDVWFDSGTTWTTLPARVQQHASDVYVEGTDQHRGWFQSSLLTHVAVQDQANAPTAPFKTLITHGFTLDAEGRKMSKSLGNVIAPNEIMDGSLLPPLKIRKQKGRKQNPDVYETPQYDSMGPDVLRLWVASSDYTHDLAIATQILQDVQQMLQKYRVTFKFLLGVLDDFDPLHHDELPPTDSFADQAIQYRLSKCSHNVYEAYKEYQFHKAVKEINSFVISDLSAFYLEICKDRVYVDSGVVRRRTQRILVTILQELAHMLGPITPHLVEEMWDHMPPKLKPSGLVESSATGSHPLRQVWKPFEPSDIVQEQHLIGRLHCFHTFNAAIKLAQEKARRAGHLRSGLACGVYFFLPTPSASARAMDIKDWQESGELADLFVVSHAEIKSIELKPGHAKHLAQQKEEAWRYVAAVEGSTGAVAVVPPHGEKCVRCWKYTAEEKEVPCKRCRDVLAERGLEP